MFVHIIEVFIL